MLKTNKKFLVAGAACLVAVASLCLIASAAPNRSAKGRKKQTRRVDTMLKIGQMAPDFELYTLPNAIKMLRKAAAKPPAKAKATSKPTTQPAEGKVRLSSFRGKRPVYLIFASYT
jgi:hypothetical protein